jgi:hypothetical protein
MQNIESKGLSVVTLPQNIHPKGVAAKVVIPNGLQEPVPAHPAGFFLYISILLG